MPPMKVLQVGPYPIQPRIHGGQRRVGALHDAYRSQRIDCRYLAVTSRRSYPNGRGDLIFVGRKTQEKILYNGWLQDLLVGEGLENDPETRDPFIRFWRRYRPDVIQLEQPFHWPAIRTLMADGLVPPARVIYSSQNVEWVMKEGIYAQVLPHHEAAATTRKVQDMEADLSARADLVVAVSQSDADAFTQMGANKILIVRNGCDRRTPPEKALARWKTRLLHNGTRRFAAFVGSAHMPNLTGFDQLLGPGLDYVPPDAKIVMCGGVTQLLINHPHFDPANSINRWRLHPAWGPLSDDDLAAILHLAHVILLPILDGGGSNLKTVEAVLSGRPIIGTPFAFRSFEELSQRPGITLCRDSSSFRRAVRDALLAPEVPTLTMGTEDVVHQLTWPVLGTHFVAGVRDALASRSSIKEAA